MAPPKAQVAAPVEPDLMMQSTANDALCPPSDSAIAPTAERLLQMRNQAYAYQFGLLNKDTFLHPPRGGRREGGSRTMRPHCIDELQSLRRGAPL